MRRIHIELSDNLLNTLDVQAAYYHMSRSAFIRLAIQERLHRDHDKGAAQSKPTDPDEDFKTMMRMLYGK